MTIYSHVGIRSTDNLFHSSINLYLARGSTSFVNPDTPDVSKRLRYFIASVQAHKPAEESVGR
jgi:hypothetical protein